MVTRKSVTQICSRENQLVLHNLFNTYRVGCWYLAGRDLFPLRAQVIKVEEKKVLLRQHTGNSRDFYSKFYSKLLIIIRSIR